MAVRTIRTYAITVLFLLTVSLFAAASWRTEMQQRGQGVIQDRQAAVMSEVGRSTARIDANTIKLAGVLATQCMERNRSSKAVDAVLDSLVESVRLTKTLPEAERVARMVRYEQVKVPIVACPAVPGQ